MRCDDLERQGDNAHCSDIFLRQLHQPIHPLKLVLSSFLLARFLSSPLSYPHILFNTKLLSHKIE
jgi:hypothetical protein